MEVSLRAPSFMKKPVLHVIRLENLFIYDQLLMEERLLRTEKENFCLINFATPPAIVMGLSAKIDDVISKDALKNNPLPLIRRFSGGGTVFVDESTFFTSFILQKGTLSIPADPKGIVGWGETFYKHAWQNNRFIAKEGDFTIDGNKKIGGNAHYIAKERFLTHTSFLWDYTPEKMHYLKHPPSEPSYRKGRSHSEFLSPMHPYFPSPDFLIENMLFALSFFFELRMVDASVFLSKESTHKFSTTLLSIEKEALL